MLLGTRAVRALEKRLSNLQLAIYELATLAALSAVGTVIDQEQTRQWYIDNYPDGPNKVLGFLDYHLLFALQLDHIYTSNYFLGITTLLVASLIACSKTQQFPLLKMSRRWRFAKRREQVFSKGNGETLPGASLTDLGTRLRGAGYEVFARDGQLYAFKGIAGRFAPIFVHVSLVMILFGAAFGALCGFEGQGRNANAHVLTFELSDDRASLTWTSELQTRPHVFGTNGHFDYHIDQVMIPEGREFLVASALRSADTALPFAPLPSGASKVLRLDQFSIDYRPDGSVGQYRSMLTERDLAGTVERRKEIYVNEPMRFEGVTVYQVDWRIDGVRLRVGAPGGPADAMQPIATGMTEIGDALGMNSSSKLFGTFIPFELSQDGTTPRGVSILAKDLQSVVFYDTRGEFVGVRRPGSGKPLQVEGRTFVVDELIGASGMQLKHDPGVVIVYTGFGFLMITTIVSYVSHSQVWALQEGSDLHVGGKTNRAVVTFRGELDRILESVPEASTLPVK